MFFEANASDDLVSSSANLIESISIDNSIDIFLLSLTKAVDRTIGLVHNFRLTILDRGMGTLMFQVRIVPS